MARKGSTKELSQQHERHIARLLNGKASPSSGAADHDAGDVRTESLLIECKMTGTPAKPPKRLPRFIQQLEKAAYEAWSEGRDPALALRFFAPDSKLSHGSNWVDVIVLPASVLADREKVFLDPHCCS